MNPRYYAVLILGTLPLALAIAISAVTPKLDQSELDKITFPKNRLSAEHAESVLQIINAQGLDEAFLHYSSYKDIPDPRFHELRQNYMKASRELSDYLNEAANRKVEVPHYLRNYGL